MNTLDTNLWKKHKSCVLGCGALQFLVYVYFPPPLTRLICIPSFCLHYSFMFALKLHFPPPIFVRCLAGYKQMLVVTLDLKTIGDRLSASVLNVGQCSVCEVVDLSCCTSPLALPPFVRPSAAPLQKWSPAFIFRRPSSVRIPLDSGCPFGFHKLVSRSAQKVFRRQSW